MTSAGRSLSVLLLVGVGLLAGVGWAEAQGILDTKHNLSAVGGTAANRTAGNQELYLTAGTAEICVFCHTPHGADTNVKAPLWNRAVTSSTYTVYASPTMDSAPSSVAAEMGVSLACLSCHDGTVAFDALRNLPGPGGYDASPGTSGRNPTGWTWNSGKKDMTGRGITEIGTDLSNDHPIAMIYSAAKSPSSTDQDETTGFTTATLNGSRVWVERTVTVPGQSSISAKLPLFGTSTADARVQCASCHDPHSSMTTFLRVDNTKSSALCRTCHKKDS
jgi:predicted CXXCH cytochrome family protein